MTTAEDVNKCIQEIMYPFFNDQDLMYKIYQHLKRTGYLTEDVATRSSIPAMIENAVHQHVFDCITAFLDRQIAKSVSDAHRARP